MATINDQDRFFSGQLAGSMPKHIIEEGTAVRLLNARFIEGAITNAIAFDKLEITLAKELQGKYLPNSNTTYDRIFSVGDIQLLAPLSNINGEYLIAIISSRIFQIDLDTMEASDITPKDAFIADTSLDSIPMSYIDNSGNVMGSGGYLVIFNYPNRPIFINHIEARLSQESNYEMPSSRLGATGGNRAFVISASNTLWASDPVGGGYDLAPLTFNETLNPTDPGGYNGQIFAIGSPLDFQYVTAIARIPRLMGSSQDFLAQSLLISTKTHKYIISAESPRTNWESMQFITYGGTGDGIAGSLAVTNIGSAVVYISNTGRIKTYSQDTDRNNSLVESMFDDALGQYLCCRESSFYYRSWYSTLDHSRSLIKFNGDRLYATVSPILLPAYDRFNNKVNTQGFNALAVASLGDDSQIGARATINWEGFYDWFKPVSIALIGTDTYVIAKEKYGKIVFYKENNIRPDNHKSTIFTRGYFSSIESKGKSLTRGSICFRKLSGVVTITISFLVNNEWVCGTKCVTSDKIVRFTIPNKCKTQSWSIPLKVEIDHNGCVFELESIRVTGESHNDDK